MGDLTIRGSWYTDPAGQYVVVVTGMPEQSVRIGLGTTVAEAWSSLETTAMQSVGPDSGEAAALRWAQHAGWIDDVEELEGADARAASSVDSPIGEIEWSDDTYAYVSAVYGVNGDQPGDCYVRVGEDAVGLWWLDDGDGTVREAADGGPYDTEEEAREAAEALAAEQHEGEDGEDAEAMISRLRDERAGQPDPAGAWCVWWHTVGDDSHVVERYATERAADAAAERANSKLQAAHPGGGLLCGHEVRRLEGDRWVEVES